MDHFVTIWEHIHVDQSTKFSQNKQEIIDNFHLSPYIKTNSELVGSAPHTIIIFGLQSTPLQH